ncbi:O-antigen ligase family protein [Thalassospira lucentensis]|uniref:O-antigen ligase family protein n=1 Tax=Thalassospira lucentensis TaxID=168935 RepID=UPI00142D4191|nr:O-antigen ligase family protein [Thalassospira lucentensis]NIZ01765.1 O-antigen ligase family protein [Thalassospira lucentensis]
MNGPKLIISFGRVLSILGLGVGSGLISLAHPVFAMGVWADSQPMVLGLFGAGALCFLGVGLQVEHSRIARRAALHPVTLTPLAIAIWSLLISPWSDHPLRSVFGTAQSGQGILWYLALSSLMAAALTVYPLRRAWWGILIVAVVSSLIAGLLGVQGFDWLYPWLADHGMVPSVRLLHFNEYLAYPGLALVVFAAAAGEDRQKVCSWLLWGVALSVLLLSRNRTAWLVMPVALLAALCLRNLELFSTKRLFGLVVVVSLAGILPLFVVFMAHDGPLSLLHSLWSRSVIAHSLLPSVIDSMKHLLIGHGWGSVPDEMIRNIPISGIDLYDSKWGGLGRDIYHSHNATLEGVMAAGLPGGILAISLPATVLLFGQRHRLWLAAFLAISWAAMDAFWFMIPASLPLIALASASVIGRPRRWCSVPSLVPFVCSIFGGLMLLSGAVALLIQGMQESRLMFAMSEANQADKLYLPMDIQGDGHSLAAILTEAHDALQSAPLEEKTARTQQLSKFRKLLDGQSSSIASSTFFMALVNNVSEEAYSKRSDNLTSADEDSLSKRWAQRIMALLREAPMRLDVVVPYFNWMMIKGRDQDLINRIEAVKALEGVDSNHPVLSWFDGSIALKSNSPAVQKNGLMLMRQALRSGLERFMPVDKALKDALG